MQVGQSSVGADGSYKVTGLPAGSYKPLFHRLEYRCRGTVVQKRRPLLRNCHRRAVTAGQALTGINATLVKGATISGKLAIPAGVSSSNLSVSASSAASRRQEGQSEVGADGSYKINGLPAGSYKLNFSGWNTGLQDQWYKNAASYERPLP